MHAYLYIIRGLRDRRRVLRRLGAGFLGEDFLGCNGFLFIEVLKPTPAPGGSIGFRNIHAGFFTVVFFLLLDDILYFTHT